MREFWQANRDAILLGAAIGLALGIRDVMRERTAARAEADRIASEALGG